MEMAGVEPASEASSRSSVTSSVPSSCEPPGRGVDPSFRFMSELPACLRPLSGSSTERVLRIWITPNELRSASRQMPGARNGSRDSEN